MHRFQETPPMPTYMVSFVISQFEFMEDSSPVNMKFYGEGKDVGSRRVDYAFRQAKQLLIPVQNFVQMNYTLPKLDFVLYPTGMIETALENWGLIVFT